MKSLKHFITIEYDGDVDAAYIYLADRESEEISLVARTAAFAPDNDSPLMFNIDLDENNRIIGMEILGASNALPAGFLS